MRIDFESNQKKGESRTGILLFFCLLRQNIIGAFWVFFNATHEFDVSLENLHLNFYEWKQ